jgi:hypothetical protein
MKWLGHLIRMDQTRVAKKRFDSRSGGRRKVGSHRLRWLEDVANDLCGLKMNR